MAKGQKLTKEKYIHSLLMQVLSYYMDQSK